MSKNFMIVLAIIIVLLGVIFGVSKTKSPDKTASSTSSSAHASQHLTGAGKTGVKLVEFGDYECPACKAYYPIVKAITDKYNKDITFQFSNFPLVNIHPNAFAGARAAEAAGLQNKYWEMHDLLYEQQDNWATASNPLTYFQTLAQQLSLNLDKFNKDFASSAVNDVINADLNAAKKLDASATPTFVIDGKKLDKNPLSQAEFEKLINDAIASKNK